MEDILFQLTNEQRKYLGLIPVEKNWDLVKLNEDIYLYFDGDIIRKKIEVDSKNYLEQELLEKTSENRTLLMPKTAKGKAKKLNFTATQSFNPFGVYFNFSDGKDLSIANYTTQTTFFSDKLGEDKDIEDLKIWLNQWIEETTEKDLIEIDNFKTAKRQHCMYKEGDFFTFKIGRRNWGFGRILIDVVKLKKTEEFKKLKNYGLNNLMGKALIVKVYHKISNSPTININELNHCIALPSQAIMDNHFYYGEKKIIGYKELTIDEYDMLISYGKSISYNEDIVYLQYGSIYKETSISKYNKYLKGEKTKFGFEENPYRNEAIGFDMNLNADILNQCIATNSNQSYWDWGYYGTKNDLRNPANSDIKKDIFKFFKLDANKNYVENLKIKGV